MPAGRSSAWSAALASPVCRISGPLLLDHGQHTLGAVQPPARFPEPVSGIRPSRGHPTPDRLLRRPVPTAHPGERPQRPDPVVRGARLRRQRRLQAQRGQVADVRPVLQPRLHDLEAPRLNERCTMVTDTDGNETKRCTYTWTEAGTPLPPAEPAGGPDRGQPDPGAPHHPGVRPDRIRPPEQLTEPTKFSHAQNDGQPNKRSRPRQRASPRSRKRVGRAPTARPAPERTAHRQGESLRRPPGAGGRACPLAQVPDGPAARGARR